MSSAESCKTCQLVARRDAGEAPAWDAILRTPSWDLVHAYDSALPGWLVLVLRRHAASVAELEPAEAAELGPLTAEVSRALAQVTGCEKTYVMQFAEAPGHPHVHFHLVPRAADMPTDRRGGAAFGYLGGAPSTWVPEVERDALARELRAALAPRALRVYQVDAFTSRPFAGNPAAVVPLERWLPEETMQALGAEMNLAETAFVVPEGEAWGLRWFTPTVEVDLCGHATLATAHALWNEVGIRDEELRFRTLGGDLVVRRDGDRIELDLPAHRPGEPMEAPEVTDLLGTVPEEVRFVRKGPNGPILMARVSTEADLRALAPDCGTLEARGIRNLMVTAPGDEADFVSRYFVPGGSAAEDPVTGSAHCALAPYWAERLGRDQLYARQVSARGGELWCRVDGDRVRIAGHAVTVLRGELQLPT